MFILGIVTLMTNWSFRYVLRSYLSVLVRFMVNKLDLLEID